LGVGAVGALDGGDQVLPSLEVTFVVVATEAAVVDAIVLCMRERRGGWGKQGE